MKTQTWVAALCVAVAVAAVAGCQNGPGAGAKVVTVNVTEKGFEPSEIHVHKGQNVVLAITRRTDVTCATEVRIDDNESTQALPLNKTVRVALGNVAGETKFACGMGMYKGTVVAD